MIGTEAVGNHQGQRSRPHTKAGHMTAADQADQNVKIALANRGRPHMTERLVGALNNPILKQMVRAPLQRKSPIRQMDLPRRERRPRQIHHQLRDLLGLADAAHRLSGDEGGSRRLEISGRA